MFDRTFWENKLSQQRFIGHAIVDGKPYLAAGKRVFSVVNPATERVLAEVTACRSEDVDVAVESARKAFNAGTWSKRAPQDRKTILLRLSQLILEHREELALLDSASMGKPVNDALDIDVPGAAHVIAWYAESIDKIYDEIAPTRQGVLATITREAIGVIAAIIPWNFPLDIA